MRKEKGMGNRRKGKGRKKLLKDKWMTKGGNEWGKKGREKMIDGLLCYNCLGLNYIIS